MHARSFELTWRPVLLGVVGIAGILSIIASGGGGGGGGGGVTSSKLPRYAYVTNSSDNTVSTYVVDAGTGRLKWIGTAATGNNPFLVTVDPSGKYAYVANYTAGTISQYTIGANGVLSGGAQIGAGTGPQTVVVDPSGKYAYVANFVSHDISQYTIGANGVLSVGTTTTAPSGNLTSVAVDPSSKYVYVADSAGGTVLQYTIGTNGALSGGTPIGAGGNPYSVVVDPSGKYVYVANATSSSVSAYSITASTGALTQIDCGCGGANFPAGSGPQSVVVDPSGKYVYVANNGGNSVSQFSIGTTGALTAIGTTTGIESSPRAVVVDPSGKYVYVTNSGSGSISVSEYSIGPNGVLAALNPATVAGRSIPIGIVVSSGSAAVQAVPKYAYAANNGDATVSPYSIGADGHLTAIDCDSGTGGVQACPAGANPYSVTVDPSGKYAYVANWGGNSVTPYAIGSDGKITVVDCDAVTGGVQACLTGANPSSVAIDPSGRYAYVANSGGTTVSQYTIGSNGALTANGAGATVPAGTNPKSVTVDPSGRFAYATNSFNGAGGNSVSAYSINASSGALTQINCGGGAGCSGANFSAGISPTSVAVDPSGRFAYVTNNGAGVDTVTAYTINAGSGALTKINCVSSSGCSVTDFQTGPGPIAVAVDPSGRFAYVANYGSTNVSQFTIGATGSLTAMTPSPTASADANPISVAVDPSGRFAYVANYGSTNVSQFTIGATGSLTSITGAIAAGTNPSSVTTTGTWQ